MNDSILLITSQDPTNKKMGTGFVVHQDAGGSYVLTCKHVIEQVVEAKILGCEVVIKAMDSSETLDLALLYVQNLYREPLKLQAKKSKTRDVQLLGYSAFDKIKYQKKSREATILTAVNLENKKNNKTYKSWQIIAKDNNEIEAGNSGGPLICQESGKVIGVISNNKGVKQGYAISIEHLVDIWKKDIPLLLIENEENEETPFVGLSAFTIKEAHLFFGRKKATHSILEKLQKSDLIAVVGESGSGKSSLIKAGVIPKYLNGRLKIDNEEIFYLLSTRPSDNAFMELADRVGKIAKVLKFNFQDINEIQKSIENRDKISILNAFKHLFFSPNKKTTLLIYIDQFEELFTSQMGKEQNEHAFIELIVYLLEHQSINSQFKIKIIFTIRTDYYDLIIDHKAFFKLLKENRYDLKKMAKEEIRECIEKPLERTYINKAEIAPFANAVIEDMDDNPHELTLLQIALNETWINRSSYKNNLLETYHQIGEVSGALKTLAEKTWNSLESSEKKILQYVFIRIIKPSDIGGATKRSANRDEFSEEAWVLAKKLTLSFDKRGNSSNSKSAQFGRLLKVRTHKDSEVLELMHEILARKWTRYRRWIIAINRNSLRKIHDGVIVRSHHYFKGKKSFLTGYELEEALRLINSSYKKYLSKQEIEFIEKSFWEEKKHKFFKQGVMVGLIIFVGIVLSLYNQADELSEKLTNFLTKTTDSTVSLLERKGESKYVEIKSNFDEIVKEFKDSSNSIEHQLVVKAMFGQAIVFKALGEEEKAIDTYSEIINAEWENVESEEFVAKGMFNKGILLIDANKTKASQVYNELIQKFKESSNSIILSTVAKAWYKKALVEESKIIALDLIKYFEDKVMTTDIKQEIVNAYAYRAWLYLLNKEYKEAINSAREGLALLEKNHESGLHLGHGYLLLGDTLSAKQIYKKYGVSKEELSVDFEVFKTKKINNKYFNKIDFLLNITNKEEKD